MSRIAQKSRGDKLESEVKDREQKIRDLEKENQKLKSEIKEIKKQRDTYKGMIFKPNQVSEKITDQFARPGLANGVITTCARPPLAQQASACMARLNPWAG